MRKVINKTWIARQVMYDLILTKSWEGQLKMIKEVQLIEIKAFFIINQRLSKIMIH